MEKTNKSKQQVVKPVSTNTGRKSVKEVSVFLRGKDGKTQMVKPDSVDYSPDRKLLTIVINEQ